MADWVGVHQVSRSPQLALGLGTCTVIIFLGCTESGSKDQYSRVRL